MYKVIINTDIRVLMRSRTDFRIIRINTYKRAEGRRKRGAKIRNPVVVVIDGSLFIFTQKEWASGENMALKYEEFFKDLPYVYREEIKDKVKMSKRLAKQSALRLKMEADAVALQRASYSI